MIITGVILEVGSPREFEITSNGLQKKQKAVDVRVASGSSQFIAEGYGDVADTISAFAKPGHLCLAEMVFGIREIDRKDGNGKMAFLKGTVTSFATF